MSKHLFQIRRTTSRGAQRDKWYTPERDIAHIGPMLVKGAMISLEEKFWEPWLKEFMASNGLSYEQILELEAPKKMAVALNRVVQLSDPPKALAESGFDQLPPAMQVLFYTRIGQVFLAAVWSGVKDASRPEDDPPASFQELLDDVNNVFQSMIGTPHECCAGSCLCRDK